MKKQYGILILILVTLFLGLLGFTTISGFGPTGTGSARNIKTGLDLAGGVSITYEASEEEPSAEDMADTIYKLQKRVEEYSEEAVVYQEGVNRINIEIPGVTDANAILQELGTPGSLYFISQFSPDGTKENYVLNYETGEYELNRTIEELEADGSIVLTGNDVKTAEAGSRSNQYNTANEFVVALEMNTEGIDKFADATTVAYQTGATIGIYYDGAFISVPRVTSGPITGGQCEISGNMTMEEAKNLASFIRIGGLKLELHELRSNVVAAQLGEEAIQTSLIAGAIGLVLVILFMILAYRVPGVIAGLALLIYIGMILVLLNAFDLTLTLPGIAGIILGIGMAVDANVIIYSRIAEEISGGESVHGAITSGFKKANSAILDGNITTLIAAGVLGWLGTGSVKGFAMTLALGIVVSMFTALVVSRLMMHAVYAIGVQGEKFYAKKIKVKTIDFVGMKKPFLILSLVFMLVAPVTMGVMAVQDKGALNFGLEFMGGTSTTVTFEEDLSIEELDKEVKPLVSEVTGDANVSMQKVVGSNQVIIKTRSLSLMEREALNQILYDSFGVEESDIQAEAISSTISGEMRKDAVLAITVATICMLLYIWIRFHDIRFASSAVAALLHDVLLVLGLYAVARISVGNSFIACMLTVVGYSINDTIVIFDRIRENMKPIESDDELPQVVNDSVNQTLTRSIYTSLTTFIMVLMLYILGVASVREFALPIMIGILAGAYSSVCLTGNLWLILRKKFPKKEEAVYEYEDLP